MFRETADVHDLIYRKIKDYRLEAAILTRIIRERCPDASSILDVACGTGERARVLSGEHGFHVDGVDLDPKMVEIARRKNPEGWFEVADMVDFDLGRKYGAVISMFSSIGYVRTLEGLSAALGAMGRHVAVGGLLIVEPWFPPGQLEEGRVSVTTAEQDDKWACRMTHTTIQGRLSRLRFEYLIGTHDGLRHASELHELGLFTREEMMNAFRAAGFIPHLDPGGPTGRGLYIARRAG
jgi:SAM-dependent methyltransferase